MRLLFELDEEDETFVFEEEDEEPLFFGLSPMKPLQFEAPHSHGAFSLLIQSKL